MSDVWQPIMGCRDAWQEVRDVYSQRRVITKPYALVCNGIVSLSPPTPIMWCILRARTFLNDVRECAMLKCVADVVMGRVPYVVAIFTPRVIGLGSVYMPSIRHDYK